VALTAQQLVALCCQAASAPGYNVQAGQLLNVILSDLCQTYDLDVARGTFNFNMNPALLVSGPPEFPNLIQGSGPYPLPDDYLRAKYGDVMWFLQGVPYVMIPIELYEFDASVQQAGLQAYPYWYATDTSTSPATIVFYPPPSGGFPTMVRYQRQMPDIPSPEVSSVVPWFPNQQYLRTRLTGELFAITDDERATAYLGDGPMGAQGILNRFLKLVNDNENRSQQIKLDRRNFRQGGRNLPVTKLVGW
jgi:hypothetical protein